MITYDLYRTLNINIKHFIRKGDRYDPYWLYNYNLAYSVDIAKIIVKKNSMSKIVDAIIFYHYPDKAWENIRGEVGTFPRTSEGFREFHAFMHKKLKSKYDKSILF